MNSQYQPSFNHHLILGLKSGLREGDGEIRQLKDKLFDAYMKDIQTKDKISELKMNFDKIIRNMQTEMETLKKDLRKEEDDNMHLKFKFEQQQAFSESKVKEIEALKNESIRVAKMSQKDEYRSKYTSLKRRLKNILRKLRNDSDSRILQEIANAIDDDLDCRSSRPSSTINNCNIPSYNSVIKVNDIEIQIQHQVSPALSTFSSTPSSSEKSPNFSSTCDENDSMELESSSSECGFTTKDPSQPNSVNGLQQGNDDLVGDEIFRPLKKEINTASIFDPTFEEISSQKSSFEIPISESTSEEIVSDKNIPSVVMLRTPDETLDKKADIDGLKMEETKISIPKCIFQEQKCVPVHETASHEKSSESSITCDNLRLNFETITKQPDVHDRVKCCNTENGSSETMNEDTEIEHSLSSIDRLFFDERMLDNAVEDLLLEMAEPLKRNEEIESMRKFFEEEFETLRDLPEEPKVCESSELKLDKTETVNRLSPCRNTDSTISSNSKVPEITMKDIAPFLDEISKRYESMLKDQTEFTKFVQKLKLEPNEEETKKFPKPCEDAYVVVLQATESSCATKEVQFPDVRDEIWNDWEMMDSLNEIDLKNMESELQDSHVLEYTSASPPSKEDILCLEDTTQRIYAQSCEDCVDNLLCWIDERKVNEELPEQELQVENLSIDSDRDVERIEEPKSIECVVKNIDRDLEGSELPSNSGEDKEHKFDTQQFVADVTESDEHDMQKSKSFVADAEDSHGESEDFELFIAESEDSERDLEDSELVIAEDATIDSEAEDSKLVIAEDGMESEITTKLTKERESPSDTEDHESSKVDAFRRTGALCEDDQAVTRYNLRRKSALNYASLDKGQAYRRKIVDTSVSPVRKIPKLETYQSTQAVAPLINTEPRVLSERHVNSITEEEDTSKSKSCLPKFYVENRVLQTNESIIKPEKSLFEQVWSTIQYYRVDEPELSNPDRSTLVSCDDALLKKAFELKPKIDRKPFNMKENMSNLNGVKRFIEEYIRSEKGLPQIAITNLLASIRLFNQATICRAVESVLLSKKHANVFDRLVRVCLEIDRKVIEGFVNTMKEHLREKMFAKIFNLDENSNGLGMINTTILHSTFYAMLCKETGSVEDAMNLLYESLICLKNRAHPIAYGVLSQWPEILSYQRHKGVLIDVILFCYVHHKMEYNTELYKINEVQDLIGCMYRIKLGQKTAEEYAKELMFSISSDYWVDAIVLLCKRQMFLWSYTNVLMKYLIPLLRISKTEMVQEALLSKVIEALRRIILSCPYNKEQSSIYNFDAIITTLADVLFNEKMSSRVLKETAYLTICELSSRRFSLCVESLSSWKPPDGKISFSVLLRLNEIMKMKGNSHNWAAFISPKCTRRSFTSRRDQSSNPTIIPIGLTRASQNEAKQGKIQAEGNKPKPKKKKKKKKKQRSRPNK